MALNQIGCDFCGVPSEIDALGKTDADFFPLVRANAYQHDDQEVIRLGQAITNRIEAAPEAAMLSPRMVVTSKLPIKNDLNEIIGVAGFSRRVEHFRENPGTISRFAKVVDHIHTSYDDTLTTEELATRAGFSVSQFDRRFRQTFGTSPRQYILRIRIEKAAELLRTTEETVSMIAVECGFHDHAHLSRSFRRIMGATPSEYRTRMGM